MRKIIGLILTLHILLLAWCGLVHSPLTDEPAHLASGLHHWHTFSFDLYRVNPPLVRGVAASPLLALSPKTNWEDVSSNPFSRAEFPVGNTFFRENPNARFYLVLGRLSCIAFSVLGAVICYLWSRELFGRFAGLTSLVLWCSSPMILAFGATILPDVAAASSGAAACYAFWKWTKDPTPQKSLIAGFVLGLAELTKFTLLTLYPIFFAVWSLNAIVRRHDESIKLGASFRRLMELTLVSLFTINFAYGFEGSFMPLKDYEFVSRTLCGDTKWNPETGFTVTGNRFRHSPAGFLPVPLPMNYVMGIDVQKYDFEVGRDSYFLGKWSRTGWKSYYALGLFFKSPLALSALGVLALGAFIASRRFRTDLATETLIAAPIVVVVCLVSLQTKMDEHLRYALPAFPFVFIGVSRTATTSGAPIMKAAVAALAALYAACSCAWLPHSQAYLNEAIYNPWRSRYFTSEYPPPLLGSNLDWGQNLYLLEKWRRQNPDKTPLFIDYPYVPAEQPTGTFAEPPENRQPGYYALGINELFGQDRRYRDFQSRTPLCAIGRSIYVFQLTPEELSSATEQPQDFGVTEAVRSEGAPK